MELTDHQADKLSELMTWYFSDEPTHRLTGPAGAGKTFLMQEFIRIISSTDTKYHGAYIGLIAPTHKAKNVLYATVHKHLPHQNFHRATLAKALAKVPIIQGDKDFDPSNPKFASVDETAFTNFLNIIDEASMINRMDLKSIKYKQKRFEIEKILLVGDAYQLPPPREGRSEVFFDNTIGSTSLTELVRQDDKNPTVKALKLNRLDIDKGSFRFMHYLAETDSNLIDIDGKECGFEIVDRQEFEKRIKSINPIKEKVLAYTNKAVRRHNKTFYGRDHFQIGDTVMGYHTATDGYKNARLVNSEEYIVNYVQSPSTYHLRWQDYATKKAFRDTYLDKFGYECVDILLYNQLFKKESWVKVLTKNGKIQYEKDMTSFLNRFKDHNDKSSYWRYMVLKNTFLNRNEVFDTKNNCIISSKTIDFGTAITVHKSQGSTYDNVFIDASDLMTCRKHSELRRLWYVALSRAKYKVTILRDK